MIKDNIMLETEKIVNAFERLIQMRFQSGGFEVFPNTKDNQLGHDFIARKKNRLFAVQVKNYKYKVNIRMVRQFRSFMDNSKIKSGILISAKGFSDQALSLVTAEKLSHFYLAHLDQTKNKLIWDYPKEGITDTAFPTDSTLDIGKKSHYISVFTAKGGVGKTTVAAHLAGAFALSGHKTTIIDGDPESNLHRIIGDETIIPNSPADNNALVKVYKIADWHENYYEASTVTILDCSPALERNDGDFLTKTQSFIVPTSLSPLDIGNDAEVLIRSIKIIKTCNNKANIFIVLNKYRSPNKTEKQRYQRVKKIITALDCNCTLLDPNEVAIRDSNLLRGWGTQPDLAFKEVAGRCYPRDDFLTLAEYLLSSIEIT